MAAGLRLRRLLLGGAALLAAGLLYAAVNTRLGLYVPCLFRTVTGWKCPGCGVTTLCLALLRLDFPAAWAANPALLLLSPLIALLAVRIAVRYVRESSALILWGVLRNVLGL